MPRDLGGIYFLRRGKWLMSFCRVGESGIVSIMKDVVRNRKINRNYLGDLMYFLISYLEFNFIIY
jgi:hypothetical protein